MWPSSFGTSPSTVSTFVPKAIISAHITSPSRHANQSPPSLRSRKALLSRRAYRESLSVSWASPPSTATATPRVTGVFPVDPSQGQEKGNWSHGRMLSTAWTLRQSSTSGRLRWLWSVDMGSGVQGPGRQRLIPPSQGDHPFSLRYRIRSSASSNLADESIDSLAALLRYGALVPARSARLEGCSDDHIRGRFHAELLLPLPLSPFPSHLADLFFPVAGLPHCRPLPSHPILRLDRTHCDCPHASNFVHRRCLCTPGSVRSSSSRLPARSGRRRPSPPRPRPRHQPRSPCRGQQCTRSSTPEAGGAQGYHGNQPGIGHRDGCDGRRDDLLHEDGEEVLPEVLIVYVVMCAMLTYTSQCGPRVWGSGDERS